MLHYPVTEFLFSVNSCLDNIKNHFPFIHLASKSSKTFA